MDDENYKNVTLKKIPLQYVFTKVYVTTKTTDSNFCIKERLKKSVLSFIPLYAEKKDFSKLPKTSSVEKY